MEQLSRIAIERSAEKRANFAARIGTYDANQLVFVDESAVDRCMTYRGRAWAIRGRKATRKAFFCCGLRRYKNAPRPECLLNLSKCVGDLAIHCNTSKLMVINFACSHPWCCKSMRLPK